MRKRRRRARIERDEISIFTGFDRTDPIIETERTGITERHAVKRLQRGPRLAFELQHLVAFCRCAQHRIARAAADIRRERDPHARLPEPRLIEQAGETFPENVTAFRPEMAVHGKFGAPCPVCGAPVQRIAYAANELNYCPTCQTGGKLLADRGLSRLLKADWPKSLEELEEHKASRSQRPITG